MVKLSLIMWRTRFGVGGGGWGLGWGAISLSLHAFFPIRLLVVLFSVILEVITMRGGDQRGKAIERLPPC